LATLSADGSRLGVANYDGAVEIYHVPPRKSLRICAPQTPESGRLVHHWLDFSPDSRWLAATGDQNVRVWDVAAATERARLPLPTAPWE
jgi:WD40 repeat protein